VQRAAVVVVRIISGEECGVCLIIVASEKRLVVLRVAGIAIPGGLGEHYRKWSMEIVVALAKVSACVCKRRLQFLVMTKLQSSRNE